MPKNEVYDEPEAAPTSEDAAEPLNKDQVNESPSVDSKIEDENLVEQIDQGTEEEGDAKPSKWSKTMSFLQAGAFDFGMLMAAYLGGLAALLTIIPFAAELQLFDDPNYALEFVNEALIWILLLGTCFGYAAIVAGVACRKPNARATWLNFFRIGVPAFFAFLVGIAPVGQALGERWNTYQWYKDYQLNKSVEALGQTMTKIESDEQILSRQKESSPGNSSLGSEPTIEIKNYTSLSHKANVTQPVNREASNTLESNPTQKRSDVSEQQKGGNKSVQPPQADNGTADTPQTSDPQPVTPNHDEQQSASE